MAKLNKKSIYIGTSGWSYTGWKNVFYPDKTKPVDFLKFYAQHFDTVEVNSSFYHILKNTTVKNWINEVPEDFVFALKADRYITHIKKLEEPKETISSFIESIKPFDKKLGPVLFQLPPSFGINAQRLKKFVDILSDDFRYVFEFRNKTWFVDEIYQILREKNIALCIYNLKGFQSPFEITADFSYIRFHGTMGIGAGKYSSNEIQHLSSKIKKLASQDMEIFCYFNNDSNAESVENAKELKDSL